MGMPVCSAGWTAVVIGSPVALCLNCSARGKWCEESRGTGVAVFPVSGRKWVSCRRNYPPLEARPIATLSIEAQERHEKRERVYRDD